MGSPRLARDLVLSGVAFVVVFAVAFFPFVLTAIVWEFSSMNRHWFASLLRLGYAAVAIITAIAAWRRTDVRLAIIFVAMLIGAAGFIGLSNWRLR